MPLAAAVDVAVVVVAALRSKAAAAATAAAAERAETGSGGCMDMSWPGCAILGYAIKGTPAAVVVICVAVVVDPAACWPKYAGRIAMLMLPAAAA